MYLLIRYPGGVLAEGVVLAKGRNRLRIAVSGLRDTIEFKRAGSEWIAAGDMQVEFDFLMSDRHQLENTSQVVGAAMVA
jgi:hypothetical protein